MDKTEILKRIAHATQTRMQVTGEDTPPVMLGFKDGELQMVISLDFEDETAKLAAITEARAALIENCNASVFVSEAWLCVRGADEMDNIIPSQETDRQEVLMCEFSSPTDYGVQIYDIVRSGETVSLRFREEHGGENGLMSRFDVFAQARLSLH
jgi:hypothetical protein